MASSVPSVFVSGQRTKLVRDWISKLASRVLASNPGFNKPKEEDVKNDLPPDQLLNYAVFGMSLPEAINRLFSHPLLVSWMVRMKVPFPKPGLDVGMVNFLARPGELEGGKDNFAKTFVVLQTMKADAASKRLEELRSVYVQWCLSKNGPATLSDFQAHVKEILCLSDEVDLYDDDIYHVDKVGTLLGLTPDQATFLSTEVARLEGKEKHGDSSYRWLPKLLCAFRPVEGCLTDVVNFVAHLTGRPENTLKALVHSIEKVLSALDGEPTFELPHMILGDGEQDDIYTVALVQVLRAKQGLPPAVVVWQVPESLQEQYSFPFVDMYAYDPDSKNATAFTTASAPWKV